MQRRADRHRFRRVPVVVATFAILAVVSAVVIVARTDNAHITVTPFKGSPPRFKVLNTYHVTYTVTNRGSATNTEDRFVRRPFESYEQEITHGKPYLTTAMRLGVQVFSSKSGQASLVHTALSPAKRDIRMDAVVTYALAHHLLRLVGRARVLDTSCYVFRSAAPLNSGPLQPIAKRSYVDSCVDVRGIVLDERTVDGGKVKTERRATHVAIGRHAAGADYDMDGSALPANRGGGAIHALTLDSRYSSGPFWDIAAAPSGFRHVGRYAVVPSQPQAFDNPDRNLATGLPGSLVATIDDVYVRGNDALVIEQGSTVNDAKFSPPVGGIDTALGDVLGTGQLLVSASASEVDAEPHEGRRFVRVVGTLPPDELIRLARSMTLQPAGTMRRA